MAAGRRSDTTSGSCQDDKLVGHSDLQLTMMIAKRLLRRMVAASAVTYAPPYPDLIAQPSFFFGSDCGLAPTQEEPNHERCASLLPPMRISQSQGNHLGFAPSRPQFANQILHFLGTRHVVGVHGAGRSPRRSYCHGYFPSSKPGWPSPHMSGNRSRRRRELADALGAAESAA